MKTKLGGSPRLGVAALALHGACIASALGCGHRSNAAAAGCPPHPEIRGALAPLWSVSLGSGELAGVAADSSANVVVGGSASRLSEAGTNAPFVAKLDPAGKVLWKRTFAGEGHIDALALDGADDIYVAGDFDIGGQGATLDLGTGVLGDGTFFLAKLDPTGTALWVKTAQPFRSGVTSISPQVAIAVDPAGDVAASGSEVQPGAFAGAAPTPDAGAPAGGATFASQTEFLAAFDPSGRPLYAKDFDGVASPAGLAFDPSGNLVVTGGFFGPLDLGAPLPPPSASSVFVARLDPTGQVQWQTADGTFSGAPAVAMSATGAFVTGTTSGTAGIAAQTPARGTKDVFLAQVDESGAPLYEETFPSSGTSFSALAADPAGGVVAVGRTNDYVDLGGGVLSPYGVVLAKFGAGGAPAWSARFGVVGVGAIVAPSVAVDKASAVIVGGGFSVGIDLGEGSLTGNTTDPFTPTMFVAKYAQTAGASAGGTTEASASASCAPATAPSAPAGARSLAGLPGPINDVAIGPTALYWSSSSDVMAAPLDGGPPGPVAFAQKNAGPMAIDSRSLYWANVGTDRADGLGPGHDGAIVASPLDGGPPVVLAAGQDSPRALALDDGALYWAAGGAALDDGGTSPAALLTTPADGNAQPSTIAGLSASPTAIAVRGSTLVVAAIAAPTGQPGGGGPGFIASVPTSGGALTQLAAATRPVSIAVDDTTVYWIEASTPGVDSVGADGRLLSLSLAGGTPVVLADNLPAPGKMVLVGSTLFWANAGTVANVDVGNNAGILSMPAGGGAAAVTPIATGLPGVGPFAVDGANVAWASLVDAFNGTWGMALRSR